MPRKAGALSTEEKQLIREKVGDVTPEEIAEELNRNVETVVKFIQANGLIGVQLSEEEQQEIRIISELHKKAWWESLKETLTYKEIKMYEAAWLAYVKQYKADVLATEESEIRQVITLELMMDQVMGKRRKTTDIINQISDDLTKETDLQKKIALQDRRKNLEDGLIAYTQEYRDLITRHQSLLKELHSTRSQRYDNINQEKGNFTGWLKRLDNPDVRRELGEKMDLHLLAMQSARQRLMRPHRYEDGTVDCPILNHEAMELIKQEEKDAE